MTATIPRPRPQGSEAAPATPGTLICAPLRIEARAVRRGLEAAGEHSAHPPEVLRTGYGTTRAARVAGQLSHEPFGQMMIMGVGGGLTTDLSPGDLVVGTEVGAVTCASAPILAGELRRAGLPARTGRITTVDHLVRRSQRAKLAAEGWLVADMESAPLAAAAAGRPVAVIRAVSDTPHHPLAGIVSGGLAALRSLRGAAPVTQRWAAACGTRQVLLAGPRSFCAGVERAIEIVERVLERQGPPVYVRKQIVHNTRVVGDLESRGAVFVDELDQVPDGATVVFSAHGVSPMVREQAARRGLAVIDATCPLVSKVHAEARRFAADGYTVALIGHAGHEEVEGTLGEAPGSTVLVQTAADVAALRPRDGERVAYLMQTTLSVDEAAEVAGALRERFPAVRAPGSDDICYATTNRQAAVRAVAAQSDLVLVAGSANSSNSVRLVETCERAGTPAYLIDGAEDIRLGLAGRGPGDRPDRRRLRASRRGGGDHLGAVRPRRSVGFRASNDHGINPVRPAQGGTAIMPMPLRQSLRVGSYLMRQKLAGHKKFPLLVELEPLFACNLKCAGCGKIQHPHDILKQRMPVEQALGAIEECGAPMVSIAGGEPLMHPQIDVIVAELIKRKKFVFLCTNALLLPKKLDKFKPSPYFAWVVHIDGLRERHDESVCKEGVFDEAVAAIKLAQSRGFKVNTNTTFFNTDTPQTVIDVLNYLNDDLGVDEMQISPAYAYEKAPDQEHFLGVEETRELFRKVFADDRRRKWRLNHTPLFLDFLEGKADYGCTAWGIPSYSLFGWQRPCYLMSDGYAKTYKELLETTDWDSYGRGKDPRCANCMAHCGYEPSAVLATMGSLRESIRAVRS